MNTLTVKRLNQYQAAYLKQQGFEVKVSKTGSYMDFSVCDTTLAAKDLQYMEADKNLMSYIGALRDLKRDMQIVQRKKDAAAKQPGAQAPVTAPAQADDADEPLEREASA